MRSVFSAADGCEGEVLEAVPEAQAYLPDVAAAVGDERADTEAEVGTDIGFEVEPGIGQPDVKASPVPE